MPTSRQEDAAFWRSADGVAAWLAVQEERDRLRAAPRRFLAELLPFDPADPIVVLDLGAGTGAAARALLDRYPAARAVLVDFSPPMAEAADAALAGYRGRTTFVEADLASDAPWPPAVPDRVDVVVSSMFLHHLPDPGKQRLLDRARTRLVAGGWLLDLDLVTAPDPRVAEVWEQVTGRLESAEASEAHGHGSRGPGPHTLHVASLERRLELLHGAGFEAVDVYWKQLDTAVTGGRRPH